MNHYLPKLLLSLLYITQVLTSAAQQKDLFSISGNVVDTIEKINLSNSMLILIGAKDSLIKVSTRSDSKGFFLLNNIPKGDYFLIVRYPKYVSFSQNIQIDATDIYGENIQMIGITNLLKEVTIKSKPILIKGDTTEYNARSFEIKPNDKVEDLLKKLPGIEVDGNGKITAQGKEVKRVLVDGEEFFGTDPKLVTQNLRADMIDKVQLYNKKSDVATFTGIKDGIKEKTINIKLREDSKRGYFGKINAGLGKGSSQEYYRSQGMTNYFRGKMKSAVYLTAANDNTLSLGALTLRNYTGESLYETGQTELDAWSGNFEGQGLPTVFSGGLHYSNKWNNDKQGLNVNYKNGSLGVDERSENLAINNLPESTITYNSRLNANRNLHQQNLNVQFDTKLSENTSLKFNLSSLKNEKESHENYNVFGSRENHTLLNQNERILNNTTQNEEYNLGAVLSKKFKKKGRTLIVDLKNQHINSTANGFLNSKSLFYDENELLSQSQILDQRKMSINNNQSFSGTLAFSEAFTDKLSLKVNYKLISSKDVSNLQSFNKEETGQYNVLDPNFSLAYDLDQLSHLGGAILNFYTEKYQFNVGSDLGNIRVQQMNLSTKSPFERSFLNFRPSAYFAYNPSATVNWNISYNGSTQIPSLSNLNPLIINTDPLNLMVGNIALNPSFKHSLSIDNSAYNEIKKRSIYLNISYDATWNPVVRNVMVNSNGVSTYTAENLKDKVVSNLYASFSFMKSYEKKLSFSLNSGISNYTYFNKVNQKLNKMVTTSFSVNPKIQKGFGKWDLNLGINPRYNFSKANIQQGLNNNFFTLNASYGVNIYLPAKFSFYASGNSLWQGKNKVYTQTFERHIINAGLNKRFLKGENLTVTLSINDILNQNVGFNRFASNNLFLQQSYNSIRRYTMLALSWDFKKMKEGGK